MIYTVTFNPAVDYVLKTDSLVTGKVNRSSSEKIYFGGKGINVSLILKELGVKSRALGFTAGFTGAAIEKYLSENGIETDFVRLADGFSRINVKIHSGVETELNGQGPKIDRDELDRLFDKLDKLESGDELVLAGSIPATLPDNIYEKILASLSGRNVRCIVDATGKLLLNVLKYKPFLVKPNDIELGEIFETIIGDAESAAVYARKLRDLGAQNVLVSMGEKGAVLVGSNDKVYKVRAVSGIARNTVGAGDSMVAGFLAGYNKYGSFEKALELGSAAGSATAFSDGLALHEEILTIFNQLNG